MNPLLLSGIFDIGKSLLDRLLPDPQKKAEAQMRLLEMQQNGELAQLAADTDLAKLQIQTNIEEAKSGNFWIAGWRPGVGWTCVAILALTYIPKALALTLFWMIQCYLLFTHPETKLPAMPPFPDLGLTDVLGILGTLMGAGSMAWMRTKEKMAGVAAK